MTQEEADIDLIERKMKGLLSEEELKQFNSRINIDLQFAEKVDDYMTIIAGIKSFPPDDIHKDVASWEKEIREEERQSSVVVMTPDWKKYSAIAAAIVLLVVAFLYIVTPNEKTNQEIFTTYFAPYENILAVRNGAEQPQLLGEAMKLYDEHKYGEAIPLFERVVRESQNPDALFYLGISYLAQKNSAAAIFAFETLIRENNVYRDQTMWYLALANLLDNKESKAKALLQDISKDEDHDLKKSADALLDTLN